MLASIPAERQRFATALQQGWHFTATGFGRLGSQSPPLPPSKIGIRPSWPHQFYSGPPALATATHGPTGIVPFGHAGDESSPRIGSIGTVTYSSTFHTSAFTLHTSDAVPHHPRSCSAFAGRDSLRSVSFTTDAATLLALEHHSTHQLV